jgi:hypothetical protein
VTTRAETVKAKGLSVEEANDRLNCRLSFLKKKKKKKKKKKRKDVK